MHFQCIHAGDLTSPTLNKFIKSWEIKTDSSQSEARVVSRPRKSLHCENVGPLNLLARKTLVWDGFGFSRGRQHSREAWYGVKSRAIRPMDALYCVEHRRALK